MYNKSIKLMVFVMCVNCISAYANTGAMFLKIDTSARASSMGGASIGMCSGAAAMNYNPSGLSFANRKEVFAQHTEWIAGMKHDYIAFALPFKTNDDGLNSALGVSMVYLTQGSLEGRDANRQKTSSFDASDRAVTLSYAKTINKSLRFGLNTKFIEQRIADETACGFACDFGIMKNTSIKNTVVGLSVLNLGPQMKFVNEGYDLPLTMAAGVGYNVLGSMLIEMDIKRSVYEDKTDISIGTEYLVFNDLTIRFGYLSPQGAGLVNEYGSILSSLSGVIGFKMSGFTTDYAFVPYGDLGNTHKINFNFKY